MGKIPERQATIIALLFVYFVHYAALLFAYSKDSSTHKAIRGLGRYLFMYGVASIFVTSRAQCQFHPGWSFRSSVVMAEPSSLSHHIHNDIHWEISEAHFWIRISLRSIHDYLVRRIDD